MTNDYVALFLGIACAGLGGEFFVRGAVGLARSLRISPGIVGATVAAFATSSPELSVAIGAAAAGKPELSLGNALGANVVNVALILALALLVSGIQAPRHSVKRDFPVALLVPVMTGALALDGVLSRLDGSLMLAVFLTWLVAAAVEARRQRDATPEVVGERRAWPAVLSSLAGLAFLAAAGSLIVAGARGVAVAFGIDEFVIGATFVAIGTTVPELATTVIAKLRGHDEVGLGNILGSTIFNGLFIVSVAAVIHPIDLRWREVFMALAFGVAALAFAFPSRQGFIGRGRGVWLLLLYAAYVVLILRQ